MPLPLLTIAALAASPTLMLPGGAQVVIAPERLGLTLHARGETVTLAAPGAAEPVADLVATDDAVAWRLPERDLRVRVAREGSGLRVRFETATPQELAWPRTGTDPASAALQLPKGGGLRVAPDDPFWRGRLADSELEASGDLTLPCWGWEVGEQAVSYLLPDEPRTTLALTQAGGRLVAEARHAFRRRDGLPAWEILIAPGPAHPLAVARAYRRYLDETKRFVPFAAKTGASPGATRLLGATHAYLWGTGRTPKALDRLRALGLDRLWLGYDQDPRNDRFVVDAALVRRARANGWLVGPYMTLENIQDPAHADTPESVFDRALFATGAIVKHDGKRRTGFAGRGYELSSEALRRAERDWIGERIGRVAASGADAPFLDVDAFGDLFDDFDPAHPMTPWRDRENRVARMRRIGLERGLVLGSEVGVAWSTPALHFAHGAHAIGGDDLWGLLGPRGKASFGSWGPPVRPDIFFKETVVSADVARALYDPTARVPLYQTVFHDALITTDRWEFSPVKLRGHVRARVLLELLYLQPAVWNIDLAMLDRHGARLAALHRFFAPLHRAFGVARLEDFALLGPDRLVQRATYAGGLTLTANFGAKAAFGVPPLAIAARWPDGRTTVFQPAP